MAARKRKEDSGGLVYSTHPDWQPESSERTQEETQTPEPSRQQLRVRLDRRHRGGKTVTLVEGFVGKESDLVELGKRLKTYCGTGGSVKEGLIIVQGAVVDKVQAGLQAWGYKIRKG